jgi:hypothetical protein
MNHFQKCSAAVFGSNQFPQWRTKSGFRKMKARSIPMVPMSPGIGVCTASARDISRMTAGLFRRSQIGNASFL